MSSPAAGAVSPVDNAKRTQILDGARSVFLSHGFDAASMGEIARAAKVAKGTLYVYFDNKEALFRALVDEQRRRTAERVTVLDPGDHDLETVLSRFARSLITALTDPAHVSLMRMVIGAVEAFPDIGREFFLAGPALGAEKLGAYLAAQQAEGMLEMEDPELAAWQFLGMCKEPLMVATSLAARPRPDAAAVERYAAAATRTFLRAYGKRPG